LKYADEIGLYQVVQKLEQSYHLTQDEFWRPAKLLQDYLLQARTITSS
jgi:hypothetical protein